MNRADPEPRTSRARSGKHTIGYEEANRHGGNKFNRWSAIGFFSIFCRFLPQGRTFYSFLKKLNLACAPRPRNEQKKTSQELVKDDEILKETSGIIESFSRR